MARKRKASPKPLLLVLSGIAVFFFIIGFFVLSEKKPQSERTMPSLPVQDYLTSPNSMRGNVYKVEGKVADSLAWSPDTGRLIAVEVDEKILPVFVTPEFLALNIQKEQKLTFILEVDEKGVLKTKKVTKS